MQTRDYSEYTPCAAEGYRLCRQGNRHIDLSYFSNSVRFNAERRTLYIQVDREKEALWMDELVEEYGSAREVRYGEKFLGLDEDGAEEDVARLDKRYRISYFPFEYILKNDQFFEKFDVAPRRVPMNNVLIKPCACGMTAKRENSRWRSMNSGWRTTSRTAKSRRTKAQRSKTPPAGVRSCRRLLWLQHSIF